MFPEIDWGMIASGMPTPGGFADRFNGATGQLPQMLPQSPISPEALGKNMAARGVPPPPQDFTPPAPEPFRLHGSTFGPEDGNDVGAALTGKTREAIAPPMDIRSDVQKQQQDAPTDVSAKAKDPSKLDKFAEGLKGVRAPANPELQRISTPAAPRPTNNIKGGELMALMQTLYGGGPAQPQLPPTLGAALRR